MGIEVGDEWIRGIVTRIDPDTGSVHVANQRVVTVVRVEPGHVLIEEYDFGRSLGERTRRWVERGAFLEDHQGRNRRGTRKALHRAHPEADMMIKTQATLTGWTCEYCKNEIRLSVKVCDRCGAVKSTALQTPLGAVRRTEGQGGRPSEPPYEPALPVQEPTVILSHFASRPTAEPVRPRRAAVGKRSEGQKESRPQADVLNTWASDLWDYPFGPRGVFTVILILMGSVLGLLSVVTSILSGASP